ncbi:MAG: T9SS type A sorting domain-containing protein, partial [Bacteroidales bacterium]|nr:T9SS type A sorting domain-containing protein [Bacteroidales bacterium]
LMRDWKKVAVDYDALVFNTSLSGDYLPLISINSTGINYASQNTAAMVSYVGQTLGTSAEAINYMPAVIGASLVGINKSNQGSQNWVLMAQDFFNKGNGENVYLNNYSGSSGNDWWYETMPNVFFYQLNGIYPHTGDFDDQFETIAERWLEAIGSMGASLTPWQIPEMNYRAWNLSTMEALSSGVKEPEAAGAIGWILYQAYCHTGNIKYRVGAEQAMEFLNNLTNNPSYELQLLYGAYNAAKMNAQIGTKYDIDKILNWCFNRGSLRGWGCIVGQWGDYDCSGLIGEANDSGNDYAFIMNGFQQAACLVPMVRYNEDYANTIAKWILNMSNASRLFYSGFLPANQQDNEVWAATYDTQSCIAHESMKERLNNKSPYATGDAMGGRWASTNLALYGSSHVGYIGAIISTTNVEAILKLDLCATDFYASSFPTYLLWNPYDTDTTVTIDVGNSLTDIYNSIDNVFLYTNISGNIQVTIPANNSAILVYIPEEATITTNGKNTLANDTVIDYDNGTSFNAYSPRIKSLVAAEDTVMVSQTITVYCSAENNNNTNISYSWELDGEAFVANEVLTLHSTKTKGNHTIKCSVSDGFGLTDSMSINIMVLNRIAYTPIIRSLIASPGKIDLNESTIITCTASDQNDDDLTYFWTTSGGTLLGEGNQIQWTAPETDGNYTVSCKVTDIDGTTNESVSILTRNLSHLYDGEPILYLPFNGDAYDHSSNPHFSSYSMLTYSYDVFNNKQYAGVFNGSSSYMIFDNTDDLNFTSSFSVVGWIYPQHNSNDDGYILSHGSYDNRWKISINKNGLRFTVKTDQDIKDLDTETTINNTEWYHFAMVYSGSDLEIYINGKLDAFTGLSGSLYTTNYKMTMGKARPDQGYFYNGRLDEVLMYNHAITTSAIDSLYKQQIALNKQSIYRNDDIIIYPNPANELIKIDWSNLNQSVLSYKLFNLSGHIIKQDLCDNTSMKKIIIISSSLENGIYLLHIKTESEIVTRKIVISR